MSIFSIGQNARVHAHMLGVKHRWWKHFVKQTQDPQAVQQALLERILNTQAQTIFGKKHRLNVYVDIMSFGSVCLFIPMRICGRMFKLRKT